MSSNVPMTTKPPSKSKEQELKEARARVERGRQDQALAKAIQYT
jgi:hypothetical protein